jgi:ABC-type sugar transport system ATPase subunit
MSTKPLVTMRQIRKCFGPVEVLHGVDFEVLPGAVHVLAGENGAGKSTLINILSGVYEDFTGEIRVHGRRQRFSHPMDAVRAGVATIHQELSLVASMSVSDNLFLGREQGSRFGVVDFRRQEAEAASILAGMELTFSPQTMVEELPISSQQLLEIARALACDASILIFDEPTSALNEHEVEFLFERIRELRRDGRGIVYITHKMEEMYRLADLITVLRDGNLVGTAAPGDLPPERLVRLMVGRGLDTGRGARRDLTERPALEVRDLRVEQAEVSERFLVDGASFSVRCGETVGLAGLQGSGASQVLHALFGALGRRATAEVRLSGNLFTIKDPCHSVEQGLMLLTNDRKQLGLAPEMEVIHSASLSSLPRFCGSFGWVRRDEESEAVENLLREFQLSAPSFDAPVRTLSGGNQQKVYLARCILTEPRVLLLDEPTRGVDVGAKTDIYKLLCTWVEQGVAILLTTSEMEELLLLSDRILVMHRGSIAAEFERETATKDGILAAAMGQSNSAEARGSQ